MGNLFARAFSFVVLVVAVNLWTNHHLGIGLGNPGLLTVLAAGISGGVGLFDRLLEKTERESFGRALRQRARQVLSVPLLAILYLSAAVLSLMYSSVVVVSDSAATPPEVSLAAVDSPSSGETGVRSPDAGFVRFLVRTSPFGRLFRLKVEGYTAETVNVYPLAGLKVIPEKDLRFSPSVLLRPPIEALASLENGGKIIIWSGQGDKREEIARAENRRSSFLIGRSQIIPSSYLYDWTLELERLDFTPKSRARTLLEWRQPTILPPHRDLEPGMKLAAKIFSRTNKEVARAEVELANNELIDLSMTPVEE